MPHPEPTSATRPTVRSVAKLAGVSPMTVSLALRNHPSVASATRRRVQEVAEQAGYRPDPTISKLMHHLRIGRTRRLKAVICGLTDRRPETWEPYTDALVASARRMAESHGYSFELLPADLSGKRRGALDRVIRARGIQGILLFPMTRSIDISELIDCTGLTVVSCTLTVTGRVHRVIPNHFDNTLTACRELSARGYRRIGLVTNDNMEQRVGHRFSAALTWYNAYCVANPVPPFFMTDESNRGLHAWLRRYKPDVLLGESTEFLKRVFRRLPARHKAIAHASTSIWSFVEGNTVAGIDEQPGEIGRVGVLMLDAALQNGESGYPSSPRLVTLNGIWHDAPSCGTPTLLAKRKRRATLAR